VIVVRRLKEPADKMLLILKMQKSLKIKDCEDSKEEAANLKNYDHPNIVKVVETFDMPGDPMVHTIVMEYCNGNRHFN